MKSIFEYGDYRAYLRDHYQARKKENPAYSFRYFARKAGLGSQNYLKLVMDGDRNLTHRHIRKFVVGLGLGEREGHYFENLVFFTQAKDREEKDFYAKNLELIRANDDRELLTHDQYQVLSTWYPLAIKELFLMKDLDPSPKSLAERFNFRITPQQAKDALELLVRLDLLRADPHTGELKVTKQSLQTPDVSRSHALALFHKAASDMAKEALDRQGPNERCFSALTVAVNRKDLPEAFARLHRFRNDLDTLLSKNRKYDAVYQLNLQLFRLDTDAN